MRRRGSHARSLSTLYVDEVLGSGVGIAAARFVARCICMATRDSLTIGVRIVEVSEVTPEWTAIWRRLLAPVPATPHLTLVRLSDSPPARIQRRRGGGNGKS